MIASILASCYRCGDVKLVPRQVSVRIIEAVDPRETYRDYRFACPSCNETVVQACDQRIIFQLSSVGCVIDYVRVPPEAREVHQGEVFTLDDVIDLHCHLEEMTYLPDELTEPRELNGK